MSILETSDYSKIKKSSINRDIDKANLEKIKNSIKARNLLKFRPIILNQNMEIIDGQHRYEAAKELNLPVYYIISKESVEEDIILLNANQKKWNLEDYLNFYINKGFKQYIKLHNECKKYDLTLSKMLAYLGLSGSKSFESFRSGKFSYPENDIVTKKIKFIKEIQELLRNKIIGKSFFVEQKRFVDALILFTQEEYIDIDYFIEKLIFKTEWLRRCSSRIEYLKIFVNIYNFNNRNPISSKEVYGI